VSAQTGLGLARGALRAGTQGGKQFSSDVGKGTGVSSSGKSDSAEPAGYLVSFGTGYKG
jgi:hypothetical protein